MLNGLHRGFTGCRKFEKAFRILRARLGRVESLGGFVFAGLCIPKLESCLHTFCSVGFRELRFGGWFRV